jgi:hypothetical protein
MQRRIVAAMLSLGSSDKPEIADHSHVCKH